MIYFFNILGYLIVNILITYYFRNKMNIMSFIIILFHLNLSFFLIYQEINVIYFLILSILSILLYNLFFIRKNNKEIILVQDGNINFHEIVNYYSYQKLMAYIKMKKVLLNEIAYLIKKDNQLILIKNDIHLNYPISIIVDGKLIYQNLMIINKNKEWLKKELLKENLLIEMIDFAYYKKNKIYFIKN